MFGGFLGGGGSGAGAKVVELVVVVEVVVEEEEEKEEEVGKEAAGAADAADAPAVAYRTPRLRWNAMVAHSSAAVFPVPVGDSRRA